MPGTPQGLTNFLKQGVRFYANAAATTWFGLRATVVPPSNLDVLLPSTVPPDATDQVMIFRRSGATIQITWSAPATGGGGGSVTDVAIDVGTSPLSVTKSGTTVPSFTLGFASAAAALVLASPPGASGVPTMRSLVATDIPSLTAAKISDFASVAQGYRLDQFASPTANLNANSQKITGLAEPTNLQDAATKNYVDAVASSQNNKGTAWVATTANINLAAPGASIDGVALSNPGGALALVKNQTNATENGLWIWNGASSPMTRATNADTTAEVRTGMQIFVAEGTINNLTSWRLVSAGIITVGSTNQTFTQDAGLAQLLAGGGMTKTGNQIDVIGTTDRISILADSIDISPNFVGQTTFTTLGVISTGTWNATPIAVARGGTGGTTAKTARDNLGVGGIRRGTFTFANLVAGILTINHQLDLVSVPSFSCIVYVVNSAGETYGCTDGAIFIDKDNCSVDMNFAINAGALAPSGTYSWIIVG
jgi:heat shock protein HslJ